MSLGAAILDADGRFGGYVLAIVDPEFWEFLLDSTRYAPDMSVSVVHSGGKIVHRVPERQGAPGLDLKANPTAPFHAHVRSGVTDTLGITRLATTGVESFVKLRSIRPGKMPSDGFLVATFARPTDAVFAPWREMARRSVAFLLGGCLLAAAGLLILQRRRGSAEQWEEAGRASAATLKVVTDTIPDPVFMKDRESRITFANPATLTVFGRPESEVLGRTDEELYPDPSVGRAVMEVDRRIMETGRPETVEETVVRSGGRRVYLSTKAPVRDGDGVITGIVGVATDITEQRRTQQQLEVASRLAAMGTLVAGVGHEINNPLVGITAGLGGAIEDLTDSLKKLEGGESLSRDEQIHEIRETLESLNDAYGSANRIAQIVKDLSAFGTRSEVRTKVQLANVAAASMRWLPGSVANVAAVTVEDRGAPEVVASPGQIEQVLVNLIKNAAKATRPGVRGEIHVSVGPGSPGMARIEVTDHGVGMPPDVLARIFDPFFTTRKAGTERGMGLGLSICHAIVVAHGGTMSVESEVGRGSKFTVELPAAPDEA